MEVSPNLSLLAERASNGDREALNDLLGTLRPRLVRTARLIVGAGSWAAEDAVQEALLDVSKAIGGLRRPEAVVTWALRLATRRALKAARRERFLRFRERVERDPPFAVEPAAPLSRVLLESFNELPPRMRAVAVLRLYQGLTEPETAEVLACRIGTVKSQYHEARKRLVQSLRRRGITPTTLTPLSGGKSV